MNCKVFSIVNLRFISCISHKHEGKIKLILRKTHCLTIDSWLPVDAAPDGMPCNGITTIMWLSVRRVTSKQFRFIMIYIQSSPRKTEVSLCPNMNTEILKGWIICVLSASICIKCFQCLCCRRFKVLWLAAVILPFDDLAVTIYDYGPYLSTSSHFISVLRDVISGTLSRRRNWTVMLAMYRKARLFSDG